MFPLDHHFLYKILHKNAIYVIFKGNFHYFIAYSLFSVVISIMLQCNYNVISIKIDIDLF